MSVLQKQLAIQRKQQQEQLFSNPLYTKKYRLKYITSNSAFNIPYKGVQCDWHQVAMLENNLYIMHPTDIIGAEDVFADYGLWNCSAWFLSKGIKKTLLCATPIRAILDKLYNEIVIYHQYPHNFDDFNDYMFDELNMSELRSKLSILKKHLTTKQKDLLTQWETNNKIY